MGTPRPARPGEPGRPDRPLAGGQRDGGQRDGGQRYREQRDDQREAYGAGPRGWYGNRLGPDFAAAAWPAFMAAGIASVIVGAILLAWPGETLTVVAVLIGVALIVAGLLRLTDGFTAHEVSGGRRVASVVIGLIAIILGLFCLRHYHFTITALAIIVGLFWVIHGIADLAIGLFAGRFPGRGLTVLTGILSLAAGLIVLFWPTISLTVLVAVIGAWLIVYGVLAAVLALRLRRTGSGPRGPGRYAPT
ncbi:MAG TPA: HdeD family acid-resistance protein [Streptosporangiaceae bacterium]|nr:HdeD family acid-resistance protein [Streptosporangiaceae bacterium]